MKRRRKKRGLNSSVTSTDDFNARMAVAQASDVIKMVKDRRCEEAFGRYAIAYGDGAKSHIQARMKHKTEEALGRAHQAFVNFCLRR